MLLVANKKASLKYAILESFQAGLELTGGEVKALRAKQGSLEGARAVVRGGEAFILGMTIPPYQVGNAPQSYDPERARRLLLGKDEIRSLADAESKKGLTTLPVEVYTAGRNIKARVVVARNKSKTDHREDLKKRDAAREMARALKR